MTTGSIPEGPDSERFGNEATAAGVGSAYEVRLLKPEDLRDVKRCHDAVLEIPYSDDFFFKATHACENIVGWVAIALETGEFVGFVTAQMRSSALVDPSEQSLIGGGLEQIACVWSESKLFYVLTMGVMEHFRNVGIGAAMLKQVKDYAKRYVACRAVYLHTIAYNDTALRFYTNNGFQRIERIKDFYEVKDNNEGKETGPAPKMYDAYLLAYWGCGSASNPGPSKHVWTGTLSGFLGQALHNLTRGVLAPCMQVPTSWSSLFKASSD